METPLRIKRIVEFYSSNFFSPRTQSSLAWRLNSITALWLVKLSIVMVYIELWDSLNTHIQCLMYVTLWTIGLTYIIIISCLCVSMSAENWYELPRGLLFTCTDLDRGRRKASDLPVITEYAYGAANVTTNFLGALQLPLFMDSCTDN